MIETEIRQIGNSKGVIFPQEMLKAMKLENGDKITAKKVAGGYFISPYNDEVSEQLIAAEAVLHKYREAFRDLSKK